MVCSTGNFFLVSILLVLLFITPSFARVSVEVSGGEISDICSNTTNPSFCRSILPSTPGVSSADYPRLAKITLDLARSNATNTFNLVKSLIPKAGGRLKEGYTSCSEHFNAALGDFDDADQDLKINDPLGFSVHTSAALDNASDCEDELKGLAADPGVVKGSQDLVSICSIVLAVATHLHR